MAGRPSFFKKAMITLNVLVILPYLVTCLTPYINTSQYWALAFPGLIFPLLLLVLAGFTLFWLFAGSRWWLISGLVLLLGFQQIRACVAFHLKQPFSLKRKDHTLRVLQWNLEGWGNYLDHHDSTNFSLMKQVIARQDADVLCLEEYMDFLYPRFNQPVMHGLEALGYRYFYVVPSEYYADDYESGVAIFSRYPIIDSAQYQLDTSPYSEHVAYIDIRVPGDTIRVFATHLESVHFHRQEYQSLSEMKHGRGEGLQDSRTIVSKLKKGYISRHRQAVMVRGLLDKSPYATLICGDFNDVPNSSTYFEIRGNYRDAFLEKGSLFGRTFRFISPTLRIDYILADPRFTIEQFQRLKVTYSDHYAIEADLGY